MNQATPLQQQLITIIQQGRQAERDAENALSDVERNKQGTPTHWALKDEVLHINTLKAILVENLIAEREGGAIAPEGDFQARNDATFAQAETMSWEAVNDYAERAINGLIAEIQQHNDAQLRQPHLYQWMDENHTLVTRVLGECMSHAFQHLSRYHLRRGKSANTLALHDTVLSAYETLEPSPYWIGKAHYNRAGAYAMMGNHTAAIPLLKTAFALRPDLRQLAHDDPDMDLIRADSDFQALFT